MLGTINSLKSVVVDGNPMKSIRRDIIMVRDQNALLIGGPAKHRPREQNIFLSIIFNACFGAQKNTLRTFF